MAGGRKCQQGMRGGGRDRPVHANHGAAFDTGFFWYDAGRPDHVVIFCAPLDQYVAVCVRGDPHQGGIRMAGVPFEEVDIAGGFPMFDVSIKKVTTKAVIGYQHSGFGAEVPEIVCREYGSGTEDNFAGMIQFAETDGVIQVKKNYGVPTSGFKTQDAGVGI